MKIFGELDVKKKGITKINVQPFMIIWLLEHQTHSVSHVWRGGEFSKLEAIDRKNAYIFRK